MVATAAARTVWLQLSTGDSVIPRRVPCAPPSREETGRVREKYREGAGLIEKRRRPSSPAEEANMWLEFAKRILQVDGHHVEVVMLEGRGASGTLIRLDVPDRPSKFLLWQLVAADVARENAEKLVHICEVWLAPAGPGYMVARAADSAEREEGLQVVVASADGDEVSALAPFRRTEEGIIFEPTEMGTQFRINYLEPVRHVWRRWRQKREAPD
jgi:hypothetical protein